MDPFKIILPPCFMVGIVISNDFKWKKQRNIREKSEQNLQKRQFPAYFRDFRPEKKFSQKSDSAILWALLIGIFVQKIRKNKCSNLEKMPKNRFFRYISGIFDRKNMFFENRARSHFRHCHFSWVCQISWKNIKYSSRNSRNTVFPAKIGCSGDF